MTITMAAPPPFPGPAPETPDPQLAEALARFLGQSPEPALIDAVKTRLAAAPAAPPPRPGHHAAAIAVVCWKCHVGAGNPRIYWLWIRDGFATCFYCGAPPHQPILM